jgi:acetolactate synthase-1/2/3 large subunit
VQKPLVQTPAKGEGPSGHPAHRADGKGDHTVAIKGAQIIVEALLHQKVDVVFGYPGGANLEIFDFLNRYPGKLRVIQVAHEQGASHMAEGYAKASGKVGVCIATSGPGATNLTTGVTDAKIDSVPIVAITGQVPTPLIGTDAFQEAPVFNIANAVAKHNVLVKETELLATAIAESFYIARSGRPGPVWIDIPKDTQQRKIVPDFNVAINPRHVAKFERGLEMETLHAIERAADLLEKAARPVIYAGGGIIASEASEELRAFARKTHIPVTLTVMGLGAFAAHEPQFLGMLGMHGTVTSNYALNLADVILAIGVRFDDRVTGKLQDFAPHARVIHIDIDASELGKNRAPEVSICCDAKLVLRELISLVDRGEYGPWWEQIEEWRRCYPLTYADPDDAIMPQYLVQRLARATDGEAIITTGVGQHQMWAAQYYPFVRPRQFLTSAGLGTMGFGLPAAIGAKVAKPDDVVIDIDGDGSFLMTMSELQTAYRHNIGVKAVIVNNQYLGMVRQWQDTFYEGNYSSVWMGDAKMKNSRSHPSETYPGFVKIAEGFGIPARKVTKKKELDKAIREMLDTPGPYVLDVVVKLVEDVYPMIPSGGSFKNIRTGPGPNDAIVFDRKNLKISL